MATTLSSGTLLQGGRYHVERVLGQGGFGITYLATHTGFGQKVALKEFFMKELCVRNEETSRVTLGTGESSATVGRFREKFLKEARNLFRLNHKHIVRVLDIFEENGTAYFAMEYAEGGSLSDRLKAEGALPEYVVTRYILQVAEALAYLHERRMNHLDVKPANIMLSASDDAVLIDFGLAKQYDAAGSQTSTTPAGISEGYAPMEQYKLGGVAEFTPETDIYALGATFFKLLTGVTPPSAQDVFEDGVPVDTLRQHNVSEVAISVIEQAMNPSKKKRMSSVGTFMAALKNEKPVVVLPKDDEETKVVDAEETEVIPVEVEDAHEYVDLGLPSGTLWATCNVGASKPEEYGDYFAWGETKPKKDYTWKSYKWMESNYQDSDGCCKYTIPDGQKDGCWYEDGERMFGLIPKKTFVGDNKNVLYMVDDVAHANWGEDWRMPTTAQMIELLDQCEWIWTNMNGVNGYRVESKNNGKYIFLPASGYFVNKDSIVSVGRTGTYWSRQLSEDDSTNAFCLHCSIGRREVFGYCRNQGLSVRPVFVKSHNSR